MLCVTAGYASFIFFTYIYIKFKKILNNMVGKYINLKKIILITKKIK